MVRRFVGVGLLAVGVASAAWAGPPPVDVSNHTITCNTVIGSVKIKPALSFAGGPGATEIKIKGKIDGCVDNTDNSVIIGPSTFKGTLTGNTSNCSALFGVTPVTGTIEIKWKADSTTPITPKTSTLTPSTLAGGTYTPGGAFGAAQYGQFSIAGAGVGVSGAFTGGNSGATSTATLVTGQDVGSLAISCAGKGIKAITLGIGTLTLQ